MNEKLLVDVFSALSLGVAIVDANFNITLWNKWLEDHTNLKAADVKNKGFFDIFPELLNHRVGQAIQQAILHSLPAVLSNSLHRSPFPLYQDSRCLGERLCQAITIVPLNHSERHCLIQIVDVSMAVHREMLLREQADKLRAQSLSDGLTGVGNRRYFDISIEKEWRDSKRNKKPLSLLMIDVDHFKSYNDTYGHLKGDTCLQKVATTIQKSVYRAHDLSFRYGGEEFSTLLPDTTASEAMFVAERIRKNVQDLKIANIASPVGIVTVSIGVTCLNETRHDKIELLIGDADEALFHAKKQGRNRVYVKNEIEQEQV